MKDRHTPGPWEAFTEDSFSGWWAIRQVSDDDLNHELGSADGGFDEADARLMAAAPDLLAALRTLVENGGIGPESMFHDARDAIAKAEGK